MILIISDAKDNSTTKVLEWLNFLNKSVIRINSEDDLEIKFISQKIFFKINNISFELSEIESIWYRRGFLPLLTNKLFGVSQLDELIDDESNKLIQFIYYKLRNIKSLNSFLNSDVNKLIVNDIAKKLKILVPNDFIYSNIEDFIKHEKNTHEYITKVISGNCIQDFKNFTIYNFTKKVEFDKLKSKSFFPSLIQNYIEKKYELRIFYFNREFYNMAIFSQNDSSTNIDFRNYNNEKPNRCVPYKLPQNIEKKLDKLMRKLQLNSGSIDMIVTPEGKYVFLEVNPIGQFGMVSYPCNYNLELKIAMYL